MAVALLSKSSFLTPSRGCESVCVPDVIILDASECPGTVAQFKGYEHTEGGTVIIDALLSNPCLAECIANQANGKLLVKKSSVVLRRDLLMASVRYTPLSQSWYVTVCCEARNGYIQRLSNCEESCISLWTLSK